VKSLCKVYLYRQVYMSENLGCEGPINPDKDISALIGPFSALIHTIFVRLSLIRISRHDDVSLP
jgi:hypothetical protein